MDIDISGALHKQEHLKLKALIKHAQKKHCQFLKPIRELAQRVMKGDLISETDVKMLKYELELALDNVSETDPEIQTLLQGKFTNFKEDEHESVEDKTPKSQDEELQVIGELAAKPNAKHRPCPHLLQQTAGVKSQESPTLKREFNFRKLPPTSSATPTQTASTTLVQTATPAHTTPEVSIKKDNLSHRSLHY